MSRDSRQPDQLAEQLSSPDSDLQIVRPQIDWAKAASQRKARRQRFRIAVGAAAVVCLAAPLLWLTRGGKEPTVAPRSGGGEIAVHREPQRKPNLDLLQFDRELSQLDAQLVALKRAKKRSTVAVMAKQERAIAQDYSDPVEEGALLLLAAAEKASQKEGKAAGQAIFRRLVEIFPESRSAEVARRQLM